MKLSPTRLKLYVTCPRKYYYTEVEGRGSNDTPATLRGSLFHAVAEDLVSRPYTRDELSSNIETADLVRRYDEAVRGVERDGEIYTELELSCGEMWRGTADLVVVGETKLKLQDYKTTSARSMRYALTSEALSKDIQCRLYCHFLFQLYPAFNEIECEWIYVYVPKDDTQDQSLDSRVVKTTITKKQAAKAFETCDLIGTEIAINIKKGKSGFRRELKSCYQFGGCPFLPQFGGDCVPPEMENMNKIQALLQKESVRRASIVNPPEAEKVLAEAPEVVSPATIQPVVVNETTSDIDWTKMAELFTQLADVCRGRR